MVLPFGEAPAPLQTAAPWWPPIVIAAAALVFAVASFWWLNARQGRLRCFEPHTFAAQIRPDLLLIRLPLALFNTGAKPIIVQDLRLRFPDQAGELLGLPWRNSRHGIEPKNEDMKDLPAIFSIQGRTAHQIFIEFGGPFPGFEPSPTSHRVRVDARLGHKRGWRPLLDFQLQLGNVGHPGTYIAYSNSDDALSPEDKEKAKASLTALVQQLRAGSGMDAEDK